MPAGAFGRPRGAHGARSPSVSDAGAARDGRGGARRGGSAPTGGEGRIFGCQSRQCIARRGSVSRPAGREDKSAGRHLFSRGAWSAAVPAARLDYAHYASHLFRQPCPRGSQWLALDAAQCATQRRISGRRAVMQRVYDFSHPAAGASHSSEACILNTATTVEGWSPTFVQQSYDVFASPRHKYPNNVNQRQFFFFKLKNK